MSREHRNDILALPFTLGWQISLFLLPMLFIVGNMQGFWVTLGIFCVCLTGIYFFWYRNLPEENFYADDNDAEDDSEETVERAKV